MLRYITAHLCPILTLDSNSLELHRIIGTATSRPTVLRVNRNWNQFAAGLAIQTTIRIYFCCKLLVLQLGYETWTLTNVDEIKLESIHSRNLRHILGGKCYDFFQNEKINKRTGQTKRNPSVSLSRLRLFAHVQAVRKHSRKCNCVKFTIKCLVSIVTDNFDLARNGQRFFLRSRWSKEKLIRLKGYKEIHNSIIIK